MGKLEYIVANVIRKALLEAKNGGVKDFKRTAAEFAGDEFGKMLASVPGARYPRIERGGTPENGDVQASKETDYFDKSTPDIERDLKFSLGLTAKDYKDICLFAYGCWRLIKSGEVSSDRDKKLLSDICIFLTENPSYVKQIPGGDEATVVSDLYKNRDWEHGPANFYGADFKTLKKLFGKLSKPKDEELRSRIITSNGYYLFPCFSFGVASEIGSKFNQGMCFFNSPTFWQQHTGDSGALFMFKKKIEYDKEGNIIRTDNVNDGGFYKDDRAKDEIVISTHLDENGEVYYDGITNGYNVTLYDPKAHTKGTANAAEFTEEDMNNTRAVLGTLYGYDVFEYCKKMTEKRQEKEFDDKFKEQRYIQYYKKSFSKHITKLGDNLIVYSEKQGNDLILFFLETEKKLVFIVQSGGFITTAGGREIGEQFYNKEPFITIFNYSKQFFGWPEERTTFVHNKRNKFQWDGISENKLILTEKQLNKIITECIIKHITK